MGIDFEKIFSDVAKGVSDFFDNAGRDITKALDQNGDGKLDFSDIQAISDRIQAEQAEAQRKADLERFKPLFPDDFERAEFVMPKMICVDEIDKLHAESAVCKGSVGFRTVLGELSAITIYRNYIDEIGLSFYPELENNVYYVDPCDRDHYISLEDYFSYMKMQRVAELQRIAQSLGAKHFRVTYKEKSKLVSSNSLDASAGGKICDAKVDAKAGHAVSNSSLSSISIEADMSFPGHAPIKPELRYLKNEINILNLIDLRMNPLSPLQHQHFNIEMSNSSGIRVKDAMKIDAMLKAMKVSCNAAIVTEAQNEARRVLEYEIEF